MFEMAKGITRPGIDRMMAWLETTDFYTAPASTRFHGAEEGGLCAHSITVAKRLLEIADLWAPNQYSRDTLLTVALFHDLCKVFTYPVSTRNVKDKTTGRWKEVPYYDFKPKESVGGNNHGDLSCYRITATGMPLSMEEYAAVNNHMGVSNAANAMNCSFVVIMKSPFLIMQKEAGLPEWEVRPFKRIVNRTSTSVPSRCYLSYIFHCMDIARSVKRFCAPQHCWTAFSA